MALAGSSTGQIYTAKDNACIRRCWAQNHFDPQTRMQANARGFDRLRNRTLKMHDRHFTLKATGIFFIYGKTLRKKPLNFSIHVLKHNYA
jgi:hypothetical protein